MSWSLTALPALHGSSRPSLTAQATTLSRALELRRPEGGRIVTDPYAPLFLDRRSRAILAALRGAGPAVRLAERADLTAILTSALCRHRFVDEHLLAALPDVEQVLILGAGWDSRAYRFTAELRNRSVIEVDLPPLSRGKREVVAARPDRFEGGHATSVEIDFRTQTLADRLGDSPFRPGAPTFVVWEGVAMYLDETAVLATLRAVAALCASGSVLAMDCYQHVRGGRPIDRVRRLGERGLSVIGEPLGYVVPAERIGRVLSDHGLRVADLATADTLRERYATGGRGCDPGLYVLAASVD